MESTNKLIEALEADSTNWAKETLELLREIPSLELQITFVHFKKLALHSSRDWARAASLHLAKNLAKLTEPNEQVDTFFVD